MPNATKEKTLGVQIPSCWGGLKRPKKLVAVVPLLQMPLPKWGSLDVRAGRVLLSAHLSNNSSFDGESSGLGFRKRCLAIPRCRITPITIAKHLDAASLSDGTDIAHTNL